MTQELETSTTVPDAAVDARGLEADAVYGKPLANYPSDRGRLLLICGVIYFAFALVLNVAFASIEPRTASIFVIGGMALAALVIGWFVLHLWNREVILYERGFSYREGSRDVFFSYGDVDQIQLRAERVAYFGGLLRRTLREMRLHTLHDESITLNSLYRRIDELTLHLERLITQARRPIVEAKLASGEAVAFASGLSLTGAGIRVENETLAWAQFRGYTLAGQLHLIGTDGQPWRSVPLAQLTNAALLITLLDAHQPAPAFPPI